MKKEKQITLLSLSILALLITSFTWAYWNGSDLNFAFDKEESLHTIEIGAGSQESVDTNISLTSSKDQVELVPEGYALEGQSSSDLEVVYQVKWTSSSDNIAGAKAKISAENLQMEMPGLDADSLREMFRVEFVNKTTEVTLGQTAELKVRITFAQEPKTKEIYEKIAKGQLKIHFDLKAEEI